VTQTDKLPQSDRHEIYEALRRADRRYYLAEAVPIIPRSPEHRADLILVLAGDLLYLRTADSEVVRREFGRRFGSGELGTTSGQDVDTSRLSEGVVRVIFTLTSARDWDRLRRQGYLADDRWVNVRSFFRDSHIERNRWHEPETIIRAVAVHYLSQAGGGRLTPGKAAELYAARLEADAGSWDASIHGRIIRQIEREVGPLP
jgi:hypothetical protein